MLILLFLASSGLAFELEAILPFSSEYVGNYYAKYQISVDDLPFEGYEYLVYRAYYKDGLSTTFTTVPLHDGTLHEYQFTFADPGPSSTSNPEPDLHLFFTNYELHLVALTETAGREAIVIDIFSKHSKQRVMTYVIDLETSLVLNQVHYDRQGDIIQTYETLEIDFDPDFSLVDFEAAPIADLDVMTETITEEEFRQHLPWLNLENLPLPSGFEIAWYGRQQLGVTALEEIYLKNKNPDAPTTNLFIWLSDGLLGAQVQLATIEGDRTIDQYSIEVLETSPDTYTMIAVPEAVTVLSMRSNFMTPREQIELLKAFVPQN